ncbi:MAG: hypothetical protein J0H02_04920 [Armatimonadetes bacterium]|nr:hypothetical protein [Armatimonadota bacterium]
MMYLPGNWIDPYTGRPLMLRVERDVFTVYSLGEDAFDQGGDWAFDIARSVPLRFGDSRK